MPPTSAASKKPASAPRKRKAAAAPVPKAQAQAVQPLFYAQITALSAEQHAALKVEGRSSYAYAGQTNSIPATVGEFLRASRDYPIVFGSEGAQTHAVAVVGLTNSENLYVDPQTGYWEADRYIPGYVRRYPFILARQSDSEEFVVCIDAACPDFSQTDGTALFTDDGEQSDYLKRTLDFVREFQADHERTVAFAQAVEAAGLLEDVNADVSLKVGPKFRLAGLRVVSRNKLRELPEKTCKAWLENGYLELIHLHLASLLNFQVLVERLAERNPAAEAAERA